MLNGKSFIPVKKSSGNDLGVQINAKHPLKTHSEFVDSSHGESLNIGHFSTHTHNDTCKESTLVSSSSILNSSTSTLVENAWSASPSYQSTESSILAFQKPKPNSTVPLEYKHITVDTIKDLKRLNQVLFPVNYNERFYQHLVEVHPPELSRIGEHLVFFVVSL